LERSECRNLFPGERSLRVLPGQYFDAETGNHYNYFRNYDPSIGRYIESDPIGLDGGLNTYLYVNASPLTLVDPTGENPAAGAGAIIGAAALRICAKSPSCRRQLAELTKRAVEFCKSVECRVHFDKKGHPFPKPGGGTELCMHWQIDCYIKGVPGSGFSIHSRLPICWSPSSKPPRDRPDRTLP
jgi:RHS repeat-associated protein